MRLPLPSRARDRRRSRGQSLVELALVTPILLLIFAAAADFGRAFYAYVAIENAAKEGAFYGSRAPLCDDAGGGSCSDPNNVTWRVRNELDDSGIRLPNGNPLTPSVTCAPPGGSPYGNLTSCDEGDVYEVGLVYPFRLITPILGSLIGDIDLATSSKAAVLNQAFDPSPGASINKFVSPVGASNEAEILAKCLEPDDTDASGYYRSPCRDSSTSEPNDFLTLRFESGTTLDYRIVVGNSGAQTLTGVTVSDSLGATGCSFSSTISVGTTLPVCSYSRTAPNVTGAGTTMDYDNTATIDSTQTLPAQSSVRVTVERPPARLRVFKYLSAYRLGDDGDGPAFGTNNSLNVTYRTAPQVSSGTVWYKLVVENTGGQDATGLAVTDTRGALPTDADCPAVPSTLSPGTGNAWICYYSVNFSSASPASTDNTITATAANVTPDGNDSATATLNVAACSGANNRTVPKLIGLQKANVVSAWTTAGFNNPGGNWPWSGSPNATAVTQSLQAYSCQPSNATITVTR